MGAVSNYICTGPSIAAGYSVDDGLMDRVRSELDPRLALLQDLAAIDLRDKVVLVRVDHNVVKDGKILDQYRIDVTLPTLYNIIERGGRPIIMTHIGRPYDKKTGAITIRDGDSVDAVVAYLQQKLRIKFVVPQFHAINAMINAPGNSGASVDDDQAAANRSAGIHDIDTSINWLIRDLKSRKIGGIYLPNTRWFKGEEDKGEHMQRFVIQLAALADVYVNDAFGSWQSHASTYHIARLLPSYAGLSMQDELSHVKLVLSPIRPFVAVVAGSKYDTKIGPLTELYKKVDKLILGGVIYNTYLCAKYGIKIKGVERSEIELARGLVEQDAIDRKIIEPPFLVESDTLVGRKDGQFRVIAAKDFAAGKEYNYVVDVDPRSFDDDGDDPASAMKQALTSAKTIFVNAVMGLMPHFWHGTSAMDEAIDRNASARKLLAGGDTLQEFKRLHPKLYHEALISPSYYLFTGGGTVLKVIEEGDPYCLETVRALIRSSTADHHQSLQQQKQQQ